MRSSPQPQLKPCLELHILTLAVSETVFQFPPLRVNFPLPIRVRISSGVSLGPLANGVYLEIKWPCQIQPWFPSRDRVSFESSSSHWVLLEKLLPPHPSQSHASALEDTVARSEGWRTWRKGPR